MEALALASSGLQKRLWLGGLGIALFLAVLIAGNFFIPPDRAVSGRMLGHDFLAFYTAGHFLREGQPQKVYDLSAVRQYQDEMKRSGHLEPGEGVAPFWNPPFYAWVFVPLAGLSFRTALWLWWVAGFACLGASITLLCRMLPGGCGWKSWGLIPLLILVSVPFQQAWNHGQNTFYSLFILTVVVTLWRKRGSWKAELGAGLAAGLLFYKPQLGAVVTLILTLAVGRRALLGVCISGTSLLLITIFTMPEMAEAFLLRMPGNLRWMQEGNQYIWERHVTLKAFWRLLIQGNAMGPTSGAVRVLWGLCELALGCWLMSAVAYAMRRRRLEAAGDGMAIYAKPAPEAHDALISATILCMPLLMPFYFDYDLLLLAIPAALLAGNVLRRPAAATADRKWLVRAWVALFAWSLVGPGLAGRTHVHLTVLLLAGVAVLQVGRVFEVEPVAGAESERSRFLLNAAA